MDNIREIMDRYNIRPLKRFGQNFLTDGNVVCKIVGGAELTPVDLAVEIGPGTGVLTCELSRRAAHVIALEYDKKLIPILKDVLSDMTNCTIINGDAMQVDFGELVSKYGTYFTGNVKVVANLPYYITSPLIMKMLEEFPDAIDFTFMIQREVAERLCASPGTKEYGALTVAAKYYAETVKLFDVSPNCFFPKPEVVSTVIRMKRHDSPFGDKVDKDFLFRLIRAAFARRRKKMPNAVFLEGFVGVTKDDVIKSMENCCLDPNCRGETLSVEQFIQLANDIQKHLNGAGQAGIISNNLNN